MTLLGRGIVVDKNIAFVLFQATEKEAEEISEWYHEPDESSTLQKQTKLAFREYVRKGEVFFCKSRDDGRIIGSIITQTLCPEKQRNLLRLGSLSSQLKIEMCSNLPMVYVGGLRLAPTLRGKMKAVEFNGKTYPHIVSLLVVETFHRWISVTGRPSRFYASAGSVLHELFTVRLVESMLYDLLEHSPFVHSEMLIKIPHLKPGTSEQAHLFVGLWKLVDNTKPVRPLVDTISQEQDITGLATEEQSLLAEVTAFGIQSNWIGKTLLISGRVRSGLWELAPSKSNEVQQILHSSQKHSVGPMDVISTGKTWGGTQGLRNMRICLSKLDKVSMIDLSNGIVVVEPGVTQGRMSDLLRGTGWYLPVTGSCVHTSLIGNALDGGLTSRGLRIGQVLGVEAIEWNGANIVKTGVLTSKGVMHGYSGPTGAQADSFIFGRRGVVTRMAFALQRLRNYTAIGSGMVADESALKKAFALYDEGLLSWFQTRVATPGDPILVMSLVGRTREELEEKIALVDNDLNGCLFWTGKSHDANELTMRGEEAADFDRNPLVNDAWLYLVGVPSCSRHHHVLGVTSCGEAPIVGETANGFELLAFAAPMDPTIICMLRDKLCAAANNYWYPTLSITITVTPMVIYPTMYFLVWATWDNPACSIGKPAAKSFLDLVRLIMAKAHCPPCRYHDTAMTERRSKL